MTDQAARDLHPVGAESALPFDISVIIACDGEGSILDQPVTALVSALRGLRAEILVVHAAGQSVAGTPEVASAGPQIRVLTAAPGSVVPHLWGLGVRSARGRVVALTTTHIRVRPPWARAILASSGQSGAAGGPIDHPRGGSMLARAAYLLRYFAYLPGARPAVVQELPGENVAYRRDLLERHAAMFVDGFWEVDVHRRLRAEGHELGWTADATVDFVPSVSLLGMVRNRLVHGAHFGRYRVRELGWPWWRALAVTPLVPAVLLLRIGRHAAAATPRRLGTLVAALPALLVLLVAWAAGEAAGAWRGRRADGG